MLAHTMWKPVAWTLGVLATLAALAGAAVVYGGLYNVAATAQHLQPVHSLLETTMHHSVARQARDLQVPASIGTAETLQVGAACYRDHCVQCHGGPGVPRLGLGMSMQPLPSALIDAGRTWKARELYWITRHGIKMSGMPAWQYRLSDDDLWAVTGFLMLLPSLSPADYAARIAQADGLQCSGSPAAAAPGPRPAESSTPAAQPAPGSPERGRMAMGQYACSTCHAIPGITGSQPLVGPPLGGIASRQLIAGRLANTHANMVAWIREPTRIDAQTAMPDLGVSARDADDMAAYLATLR